MDASAFIDDLHNAVRGAAARAARAAVAQSPPPPPPPPPLAACPFGFAACSSPAPSLPSGSHLLRKWHRHARRVGARWRGWKCSSVCRSATSRRSAAARLASGGWQRCLTHPPAPASLPNLALNPCSSLREQRCAALTPEQAAAALHGTSQLYLAIKEEVGAAANRWVACACEAGTPPLGARHPPSQVANAQRRDCFLLINPTTAGGHSAAEVRGVRPGDLPARARWPAGGAAGARLVGGGVQDGAQGAARHGRGGQRRMPRVALGNLHRLACLLQDDRSHPSLVRFAPLLLSLLTCFAVFNRSQRGGG